MARPAAGFRAEPLYTGPPLPQRFNPLDVTMRRPQLRILSVAAFAAVALLAACSKTGGGAAAGATIRVGEFASLTGKEATFGTSSHEGTLLAIDEVNAAGGVLGKKLELVYEDNRS